MAQNGLKIRIFGPVKCIEIGKNTNGESTLLSRSREDNKDKEQQARGGIGATVGRWRSWRSSLGTNGDTPLDSAAGGRWGLRARDHDGLAPGSNGLGAREANKAYDAFFVLPCEKSFADHVGMRGSRPVPTPDGIPVDRNPKIIILLEFIGT
uniref:Uncharacterized protein n=2 Tax=Oryza TaxID=4527 RepID=A0A0E0NZ59_ORYRU